MIPTEMKSAVSDYRTQVLLRGFNTAFFRDKTNNNRQLHWHFAGKCEAFLCALSASMQEVGVKLREAEKAERRYQTRGDLKKWNYSQGLIAGLLEVIGLAEADLNRAPAVLPPRAPRELPAIEPETSYGKECAKMLARAVYLRGAYKPTAQPYHYFQGMETALKTAHKHTRKELGILFLAARKDAGRLREQPAEHHHFTGVAAAYAEVLVLSEHADCHAKTGAA
jgi:hypothetical protein